MKQEISFKVGPQTGGEVIKSADCLYLAQNWFGVQLLLVATWTCKTGLLVCCLYSKNFIIWDFKSWLSDPAQKYLCILECFCYFKYLTSTKKWGTKLNKYLCNKVFYFASLSLLFIWTEFFSLHWIAL